MTAADSSLPIACNLHAFSARDRERHASLLQGVSARILETRELSDGFAFRFAAEGETIAELAEWIGLERICCPFLRFSIEVEANAGPVWLRLTGSAQVKAFVGSAFHTQR
jgi:hypothetical protein